MLEELTKRDVAWSDIPGFTNYCVNINRNSLDNRVCNLRWVTAKENCNNRGGKYAR